MASGNDFDPSSAVQVEEEFDPATAVPAESSPAAVESARLAISNLAPQATQVLSAYRENPNDPVLRHLDNSDIVNLNLLAQAGKTFPERVGDKGMGAFTNVGKAWQGLKQEGSEMIRKTQAQFQEPINAAKHGEYGLAARQALTLGPRTMRDFGVAALHGAEELAPLGYDLGNAALQASPAMRNFETISPEKAQQVEAMLNAGSDIFHAGVTQGGHEQSKFFNAEEGNVASFLGEQAPAIALGGPEALSLASKAPAIATKIVEGGSKMAHGAVASTAEAISKKVPAAVTIGSAVTGAAAGASHGGLLYELGGMLLGGVGVQLGGVKNIIAKIIQKPLDQIAKESKIMVDAPAGMTRAQAAHRSIMEEANNVIEDAQHILKSATPKDIADLQATRASTGLPQFDSTSDVLSPLAQQIRKREEQSTKLLQAAKAVEQGTTAANISKWTQDAAKYLTTLGITTGEATLVGAGIAGAASPVGDVEAPASGAVMGAGVGLGLGAAMTPASMRASRQRGARAELQSYGSSYLPKESPLYPYHEAAMKDLTPDEQDHVNILSGLSRGNEALPIVVVKPEDMTSVLAKHENDKDLVKAPFGYVGKKALYVLSDTIKYGTGEHELMHGIGIDSHPDVVAAIEDMKQPGENREQLIKAIDKYNSQLQNTDPTAKLLSIDSKKSTQEIAAALGVDILRQLPPEALYGGKSGGEILKSWLDEKFNKKNSTTAQYGFPVTPEMRSAMQKALFKAGEKAKFGEVKPNEIQYPSVKSKSSNESIDPEIAKSLKKKGFTDEQIAKLSPEDIGPKLMPAEDGQKRARTGGEYGPNGEWYAGGRWIATTDMPKRIRERMTRVATGREQIEPGFGADKYAVPKAGEVPILARMGGSIFDSKTGELNREFIHHQGYDPESIREFEAAAQAWKSGERYVSVYEYPRIATYKDAARLIQSGKPIPGTLLDKMPPDVRAQLERASSSSRAGDLASLSNQAASEDNLDAQSDISDRSRNKNSANEDQLQEKSFMPSPIDQPASQIDGMIFKGSPEAAKEKAKDFGISKRKIGLAKLGFVKKNGEWIDENAARLEGEETGQLPESTKDKLTSQDFDVERKFMPAKEPESSDFKMEPDNTDKASTRPDLLTISTQRQTEQSALQKLTTKDEGPIIDLDLSPEEQRFQELFHKEDRGLTPKEEKELNDLTFKVMGKYGSVENFEKKFPAKEQKFMPAPPEYEQVANDLALRYEGSSLGGRAIAFTDRKTGSTIDFPKDITPEDLASQIKAHREKFIEAKPKDKDQMQFMPSSDPDAIKNPAWRLEDGRIISADVAHHSLIPLSEDIKDATPGFVTNDDKFLNREQAYVRAKEKKQINKEYDKEAAQRGYGDYPDNLEQATFDATRSDPTKGERYVADRAGVWDKKEKKYVRYSEDDTTTEELDKTAQEYNQIENKSQITKKKKKRKSLAEISSK